MKRRGARTISLRQRVQDQHVVIEFMEAILINIVGSQGGKCILNSKAVDAGATVYKLLKEADHSNITLEVVPREQNGVILNMNGKPVDGGS